MATATSLLEWYSNANVPLRAFVLEKNDSDIGTWEPADTIHMQLFPDTDQQFGNLVSSYLGTFDFVYGELTGSNIAGGGKAWMFADLDPVDTGRFILFRWASTPDDDIDDARLDWYSDITGTLAILQWNSDVVGTLAILQWASDVAVAEASFLQWASDIEESGGGGGEETDTSTFMWYSDIHSMDVSTFMWYSDIHSMDVSTFMWYDNIDSIGGGISTLEWANKIRARGGPVQEWRAGLGARIAQQWAMVQAPQRVRQQWAMVYPLVNRVRQQWVINSPVQVRQQWVIDSRLLNAIKQRWDMTYDLLTVDPIKQQWRLPYSIIENILTVVNEAVTVVVDGVELELEECTISIDEGQFAWTCQLTLMNPAYYFLFTADKPFTIDLLGEEYSFIVDTRTLTRSSQVSIAATVQGISPSAKYAAPRAAELSKTWDTAESTGDIVLDLAEESLNWGILLWTIPAFRLGVSNATPMDVLQLIAKAAGALVETAPDGSLVARYAFPTPVPQYALVEPDQLYRDDIHNFSVSEQSVAAKVINRLRIMDVVAGASHDTIEWTADETDPSRGVLRVWPAPWRESFIVTHTSDARIALARVGVQTEELTETVEIINGAGSVAKPIYQLLEVEYLYVDLGGVAFAQYDTQVTTTVKDATLVRLTYRTRFVEYNVVGYPDAEVQFLVRE